MNSAIKKRNESDDDYINRLNSVINNLREVLNKQQKTVHIYTEKLRFLNSRVVDKNISVLPLVTDSL